jgi:uncharacterized protein YbjT (DUF2867 family)
MILVTGASGTVGRHVVRLLLEQGHAVRAMTRSRTVTAPNLGAAPNLDVVVADFDDAASLRHAVAGVRAVFLLTAPDTPSARHDRALVAAACSAPVRLIVKMSAIGADVVGAWHLEAEQAVRDSGLEWTVLRPSSFASNVLHWADPIRAGVPITNLTGDGAQGVIDPRDIAAVAAAALTGTGHAGRTYTLTGPELLSVPQQARQLAEIIGRPVRTADVPADVAREQLLGAGLTPLAVEAIIVGSAWARAGHNAVRTDAVERILGRPPTSFRTWAVQHRDRFADIA